MLRGVRVDGALVRSLRRSKGWNQKTLAESAGVSERTVRNAEKSQPLQTHIANYISEALEVALSELVAERPKTGRCNKLHKFAQDVGKSYLRAVIDRNYRPITELLHPLVDWNLCGASLECFAACNGWANANFGNCASGREQVLAFIQHQSRWWSNFSTDSSQFEFHRTDVEGDMIYLFLSGDATTSHNQPVEIWQTFNCRCDEEMLVRVDQCIGISHLTEKPLTSTIRRKYRK